MFVDNLIHRNYSAVAAWSDAAVDDVWRASLSVYLRNSVRNLSQRRITSEKLEMFLPPVKTRLLTEWQSKLLFRRSQPH